MAKKKEMCSLENHESGAGIVLMKLEELHSFEGHPFKVERNQELFEFAWRWIRNHSRTQKKRSCTLGRSYGSSSDYSGTG